MLSIGYRYPNQHMAEGYNAVDSPMWSHKAFAALALPEGDSFWSAAAEPLPEVFRPCAPQVIGAGDLIVQHVGTDVYL